LNAALLSAETAMRLNQSIWLDTPIQSSACGVSKMRAELLNYVESTYWWLSHRGYPSGCVVRRCIPKLPLRRRQRYSSATGADPLVVVRGTIGHFVSVSQLPLDLDQVLNMQSRGEWFLAESALCLLSPCAGILIE